MNILIEEAKVLYDKYFENDDFVLIYQNDLAVSQTERYHKGTQVTPDDILSLLKHGIPDMDVEYSKKLIAYLIVNFPGKYRKPVKSLSFVEIDKIMHAYNQINKRSSRKRHLIACSEVYKTNNSEDLLLEYNEHLAFEKWNMIKTKVDKAQNIDFRFSERGIIVFVDLRPERANFQERFYKNSNLISILVGQQQKDKVIICNDFIGTIDVHQVDDPLTLLETYISTKAKLIILGDELTEDYKKALVEVKKWDKFARFLVLKQFDLKNKEAVLQQIKKAYNSDNWNIEDYN